MNGANMNGNTNNGSQVITLQLSLDDVNIVLGGLGEVPAKISLAVIERVRQQASAQLQQNAAPANVPVTNGEIPGVN